MDASWDSVNCRGRRFTGLNAGSPREPRRDPRPPREPRPPRPPRPPRAARTVNARDASEGGSRTRREAAPRRAACGTTRDPTDEPPGRASAGRNDDDAKTVDDDARELGGVRGALDANARADVSVCMVAARVATNRAVMRRARSAGDARAAGARHLSRKKRRARDTAFPRAARVAAAARGRLFRVVVFQRRGPKPRGGYTRSAAAVTVTSSRASGGDAADDEFGRAGRDARHEVRAREGSPSVDQTDAEPTACSPTRRTRLGILHVKTCDDHRAKIPGQWGGERQPSRAGPPDGRATTTRCRGAASHSTVM